MCIPIRFVLFLLIGFSVDDKVVLTSVVIMIVLAKIYMIIQQNKQTQ